jgi:hypothetical protein
MKRTLILDTKGEALASTSEEFDRLNIMVAEQDDRYGKIPAQKFVVYGRESLKELQKFIGTILQSQTELKNLQDEHKILVDQRVKLIEGTPEQHDVSEKIKVNREKYNRLTRR